MQYIRQLRPGKIVLWCYLIWYLVTVYFYFDPSPTLWLNSLGISLVIGSGLLLSVGTFSTRGLYSWQSLRLYLMPFGVSSFSSLIKGHGYILILPPIWQQNLFALGCCISFIFMVWSIKVISQDRNHQTP